MVPGGRLSDSFPSRLHDHAALKYIELRLHQAHSEEKILTERVRGKLWTVFGFSLTPLTFSERGTHFVASHIKLVLSPQKPPTGFGT